jgi:hypothetical protein
MLALAAIGIAPSLFAIMTTQVSPVYYVVRPQMATGAPRELALFVLTIASSAVVVRVMIVLAAIANDAPSVSFRNALAATRGNALYIVLATFLCGIPLILGVTLAFAATSLLPWKVQAVVIYLALSMTTFIAVTLAACIASRIYQAMGDQLGQPTL